MAEGRIGECGSLSMEIRTNKEALAMASIGWKRAELLVCRRGSSLDGFLRDIGDVEL